MRPAVPRPQEPWEPQDPHLVALAAQHAVMATVNARNALEEDKALGELLFHVEQEIAHLAVKFSKSERYLCEHFHFMAKSDKKKHQKTSMYNTFIHLGFSMGCVRVGPGHTVPVTANTITVRGTV